MIDDKLLRLVQLPIYLLTTAGTWQTTRCLQKEETTHCLQKEDVIMPYVILFLLWFFSLSQDTKYILFTWSVSNWPVSHVQSLYLSVPTLIKCEDQSCALSFSQRHHLRWPCSSHLSVRMGAECYFLRQLSQWLTQVKRVYAVPLLGVKR